MKHPNVYIVFLNEKQPFDGRVYLRRDTAEFALSQVSPRLNSEAHVVEYTEVVFGESPRDGIVFYNIEAEHLKLLMDVAKRLNESMKGMSGDEMSEIAHVIMGVVRYASALRALQHPGDPHVFLHLKEKP